MSPPDSPDSPDSPAAEPSDPPALPEEAKPSLQDRVLAIPAGRRRALGVAGLLVGLALLAAGLGSLDSGSTPVSVPGSLRRGSPPAAPAGSLPGSPQGSTAATAP